VREREEGLRTGGRQWLGLVMTWKESMSVQVRSKNYGSTHWAMHNGDGGCDSG